jgi:non-canonical (house-cleaning) NTP pyrophosphatase
MVKFKRVILGTENKEKCKTIKKNVKKKYKISYNNIIYTSVESGVYESPVNNKTFKGARNRVKNCI